MNFYLVARWWTRNIIWRWRKGWQRHWEEKRSDLWNGKNWLLHHDNAPAHPSLLIRDFPIQNETMLVPQRPYSSDITPADFFLFTKLKSVQKGRWFESVEEIKENSLVQLRSIPKEEFQECFQNGRNARSNVLKWRGTLRRGQSTTGRTVLKN